MEDIGTSFYKLFVFEGRKNQKFSPNAIETLSKKLHTQYHKLLEDKLRLFEGGIRRGGAIFTKILSPHPNNVLLDETFLLDKIPIVRGRIIFNNNAYEIEIRNCVDFTRKLYLAN